MPNLASRLPSVEEEQMTATGPSIPAAQYLRMSTEHQQFSFDNQSAAIRAYAAKAGFAVTQTYSDAGKSGLVLKQRDGLRQLLNDVVGGTAEYQAILVYDVSRWGRFQDADEAAHYEFLCKAAGIKIHYCAEQFSNDNSFSSSMMKALKRVMASEYSRELSVKVNEGSKRVSQCGFRTGGTPGYGLRRMLVSANRDLKCPLLRCETKSVQSDRVILVPGPDHEVRWVHDIFRMFTEEQKWPAAIAGELRQNGISYSGATRTAWYAGAVNRLLKNPKYSGCSVFGQSTRRLHARRIANPRKLWTITKHAWEPIVDEDTFDQAQKRFEDQTIHKTDTELLSGLRRLLEERGTLSEKLLSESHYLSSAEPYIRRFGSLSEAFEKVGYMGPRLTATRTRRIRRALRDQIIAQVVATDPNRITVIQSDGHFRPRLRVLGLLVSVFVCRCSQNDGNEPRWILNPVRGERKCIALIVLLNSGNKSVMDLFVVPDTAPQTRYTLKIDDPWLRRGKQLGSITDFLPVVRLINVQRKCHNIS
jgi:DNA invertase Pin-like site-specific DNA recombinase